MPQIRLRKAMLDDVPVLGDLIAVSARGLSAGFYAPEQVELALTGAFGVDRDLIRDQTYLVAEQDGRPVACGGWSRRRVLFGSDAGGPCRSGGDLTPGRDPAYIRALFVHPDAARRGIGRAIMAVSEAEARLNGFMALELMATLPGVPLYDRLGYGAVERHTHLFPLGGSIDFVRMRKDLVG